MRSAARRVVGLLHSAKQCTRHVDVQRLAGQLVQQRDGVYHPTHIVVGAVAQLAVALKPLTLHCCDDILCSADDNVRTPAQSVDAVVGMEGGVLKQSLYGQCGVPVECITAAALLG